MLREALDVQAPEAEVRKRSWFLQARAAARTEQDRNRGPTQAEKVRFILEGRAGADTETAQEAVREIEGRLRRVVRAVYTRASTATHVQREREEIRAVLRYMRAVLLELLPA